MDNIIIVNDFPVNVNVTEQPAQVNVIENGIISVGGNVTGNFYPADNPSGFITSAQAGGVQTLNGISGVLNITGGGGTIVSVSGNLFLISGLPTGVYALQSDLVGSIQGVVAALGTFNTINQATFATITNLNLTGQSGISLTTGSSGALQTQINTITSNYSTNTFTSGISGVLRNDLVQTGNYFSSLVNLTTVTGISVNGGNPMFGFVNFVSAGSLQIQLSQDGTSFVISGVPTQLPSLVTGISVTGAAPITGLINFTGIGGLQISQNGNVIQFSGGSSNSSSIAGITGISITGGNSITGILNITGSSNVTVTQSGNLLIFNVVPGNSFPYIFGNVNINSGVNSQFIQFPQNFPGGNSNVVANIINLSGEGIVPFQLSGLSTSGFYINLSNTINSKNYFINYQATTGSGFYTISSFGGNNQTIPLVGVLTVNSISGNININGGTGILVTTNGQTITVASTGQIIDTGFLSGYATNNNLTTTGQTLYNLVTNLSGIFNASGVLIENQILSNTYLVTNNTSGFFNVAVTGISITGGDSLTGQINITGKNNITLLQSGNSIYITNNTGYLSGYATNAALTNASGLISNNLTQTGATLSSNLSQTGSTLLALVQAAAQGVSFINGASGLLMFTGAGNVSVIVNGQTFTFSGNTGYLSNYSTVVNLQSTGSNLQTQINSLNTVLQGEINTINSNPSGFLNFGVTGISITGSRSITGKFNITGDNTINYNLSGQTLIISVNQSVLAVAANLQTTGQILYNDILGLSGQLNATGNNLQNQIINSLSTKVTGISVNNNVSITGLVILSGGTNVNITSVGNVIQFSLTGSGSSLPCVIGNVNLSSGSNTSSFIQFSQNFLTNPNVFGDILNSNNDPVVSYNISGLTTSGFYLHFSTGLPTNNYSFNYFAITGSGFYSLFTSSLNTVQTGPQLYCGSGSPEGIQVAVSGSLYTDYTSKTLYQKITGVGAFGWA